MKHTEWLRLELCSERVQLGLLKKAMKRGVQASYCCQVTLPDGSVIVRGLVSMPSAYRGSHQLLYDAAGDCGGLRELRESPEVMKAKENDAILGC